MKSDSWLPAVGFPGYEVSDSGLVRSVERTVIERNTGRSRVCKSKVLKPNLVKGYWQVGLSVGGELTYKYVHQLVCEAFNGPRTGETRHLDGNRLNNTPANLRWGTTKENAADRVRHGTSALPRGPRNWAQIVKEAHLYDRPDFHHGED